MPTNRRGHDLRGAGVRTVRLLVALAVTGSLLAACGDDSDQDEEVIAELAADLQAEEGLEEIDFSEEEARCTAEQVVDELGAERVEEAGLIGEEDVDFTELAEEEIEAIASALNDCVEGIEGQLASAVEIGILESADASLPIDQPEAECVAAAVVDALGVERLLVVGAGAEGSDPFAGGALTDEEANAIADGFLECVDIRGVFLEQFRSEGVPEETANCLADEIDEAQLRALFAAEFSDRQIDPDVLLAPALEACGLG